MRIFVKSEGRCIRLAIPTNLVFSPIVARLAIRFGLQNGPDSVKNISPDALNALFAEFRRIKKQHGQWELVDVVSSGGEEVKIVL